MCVCVCVEWRADERNNEGDVYRLTQCNRKSEWQTFMVMTHN
jgi:hypothetical protein